MEVKIKIGDKMIDAKIVMMNGDMIVSPKVEKFEPIDRTDWQQVRIQAAIAAMQGIISNETRHKEAADSWEEDRSFLEAIAKDAYLYADNLVEELKLCKV